MTFPCNVVRLCFSFRGSRLIGHSGYLENLRTRLLASQSYLGNKRVLEHSGWSFVGCGNTWMVASGGVINEASLVVVGNLASSGAELGVLGSYGGTQADLERAKWRFVLERPKSTCFVADFDRAVFVLNLLQGLVSDSGVNKGVVRQGLDGPTIALAAPLFVKKV